MSLRTLLVGMVCVCIFIFGQGGMLLAWPRLLAAGPMRVDTSTSH